jgi:hypothetical protein
MFPIVTVFSKTAYPMDNANRFVQPLPLSTCYPEHERGTCSAAVSREPTLAEQIPRPSRKHFNKIAAMIHGSASEWRVGKNLKHCASPCLHGWKLKHRHLCHKLQPFPGMAQKIYANRKFDKLNRLLGERRAGVEQPGNANRLDFMRLS